MPRRLILLLWLFIHLYPLLYGQSITFSELNYNSDSTLNSGNWVELFNYGTTNIDLGGWYLKDDNSANTFIFPAGSNLAAGARLVVVNDQVKFTEQFPLVTNYLGEMSFSFGNDADEVRLFDNTGALKLYMNYTDTLPWPSAADGTGRTLELLDPQQSPGESSNWFVGCMLGSPGKAFTPCDDPLVFSEINYNSDTLLDAGDWIELYNRSGSGINLTGWHFTDSNNDNAYSFPNNTQIAAGARLVLVHDPVKFNTRHPDVTNYIGPFIFNLSNDGELVRLYKNTGKLTFSVLYDDDGDWPEGADGGDYTLELLNPTGNMNSFTNWFTGCPEGSPGVAYNPDCNVGIEAASAAAIEVSCTQQNEQLTIVFPADVNYRDYAITLFNVFGERLYYQRAVSPITEIETGHITGGICLLSIQSATKQWTQKFFIH